MGYLIIIILNFDLKGFQKLDNEWKLLVCNLTLGVLCLKSPHICINGLDEDALRHKMHFLFILFILKWCLSSFLHFYLTFHDAFNFFLSSFIPKLFGIVNVSIMRQKQKKTYLHLVIFDIILSSVLFIANRLFAWPNT